MKNCPKCKSKNITLFMGGQFGTYECKSCGYMGPIIVEKKEEKLFFPEEKNHPKGKHR